MLKIIVEKPSEDKLKQLDINSWGIWECKVSEFDWAYTSQETCYFFEGNVEVVTPDEKVEINPGDLVVFPKDLKCKWNVKKPVRKAYKFG